MRSKEQSPLIGRKILFKPAYMDVGTKTGTIIWVHPRGRFVVVSMNAHPVAGAKNQQKYASACCIRRIPGGFKEEYYVLQQMQQKFDGRQSPLPGLCK